MERHKEGIGVKPVPFTSEPTIRHPFTVSYIICKVFVIIKIERRFFQLTSKKQCCYNIMLYLTIIRACAIIVYERGGV